MKKTTTVRVGSNQRGLVKKWKCTGLLCDSDTKTQRKLAVILEEIGQLLVGKLYPLVQTLDKKTEKGLLPGDILPIATRLVREYPMLASVMDCEKLCVEYAAFALEANKKYKASYGEDWHLMLCNHFIDSLVEHYEP
jgi:hypothetical protein